MPMMPGLLWLLFLYRIFSKCPMRQSRYLRQGDNPTGVTEGETTNKQASIRQKHVSFVFFFYQ